VPVAEIDIEALQASKPDQLDIMLEDIGY